MGCSAGSMGHLPKSAKKSTFGYKNGSFFFCMGPWVKKGPLLSTEVLFMGFHTLKDTSFGPVNVLEYIKHGLSSKKHISKEISKPSPCSVSLVKN